MTCKRDGGLTIGFATLILLIGSVTAASAQGFISPFVGYDFRGNSRCAVIASGSSPLCAELAERDDRNMHIGGAFGIVGSLVGAEFEIGYGRDFTVEFRGRSSGVLIAMGNAIVGPRLGRFRPFALLGLGLINTRAESDQAVNIDNNHLGWNGGGGVVILLGEHVGVRGDVRYFQTVKDLQETEGRTIDGTKLSFARVSGGVLLTF